MLFTTKLAKIERDIAALPHVELAHLREWFEYHKADVRDRRIQRDAAVGRLDALADAAHSDQRASKTHPL